MPPTVERLRQLVNYSPETGVFIRCVRTSNRIRIGDVVGSITSKGKCKYLRANIDGNLYYLHQLAWLYMTGEWATKEIDHKDGNGLNNRWANLRLATHAQNSQNRKPASNNKSGVKGVCWDTARKRWLVTISADKKQCHIGRFVDKEVAMLAYQAAAQKVHGEFANT